MLSWSMTFLGVVGLIAGILGIERYRRRGNANRLDFICCLSRPLFLASLVMGRRPPLH